MRPRQKLQKTMFYQNIMIYFVTTSVVGGGRRNISSGWRVSQQQ